jgi:hypothetical protein
MKLLNVKILCLFGNSFTLPWKISHAIFNEEEKYIFKLLLYWGYTVTFTKVFTIHHSWIHPLHHSPLFLLLPIPGIVSTTQIFLFMLSNLAMYGEDNKGIHMLKKCNLTITKIKKYKSTCWEEMPYTQKCNCFFKERNIFN